MTQATCTTGGGTWTISGFCPPNPCPPPPCQIATPGRFGGSTTAVATTIGGGLLVARGTTLELFNLANPNAPVAFFPPRRTTLPSVAVKISSSAGSNRAWVLCEDGDLVCVTIATSPQLDITATATTGISAHAVDLVADGDRVYVASLNEDFTGLVSSSVRIYIRAASGSITSQGSLLSPQLNGFGIDRLAMIGNILWLGTHHESIGSYALEGWNVSDPLAPTHVVSSVRFTQATFSPNITSLVPIGNRLMVTYSDFVGSSLTDWLRAADVSNPALPVWHPAVDLGGRVDCAAATSNLLRVAMYTRYATWDTTNPASLTSLGSPTVAGVETAQMVAGATTDYWAANGSGLVTMNLTNPAAPSVRTTTSFPSVYPTAVRQSGNITVVGDGTSLRLFDYTLLEAQQLRSSITMPAFIDSIQIIRLNATSPILACVATFSGVTIVDITTPTVPIIRATIPVNVHLFAATGSRLYVMTSNSELKVYSVTTPTSPVLLTTTQYGGVSADYICLTAWNESTAYKLALGTENFGLWLIDANAATSNPPSVAAVYNPFPGRYHVRAVAIGTGADADTLYVGSELDEMSTSYSRLEHLSVFTLSAPSLTYVSGMGLGAGSRSMFRGLLHVENSLGRFLIGTGTLPFTPELTGMEIFDLGGLGHPSASIFKQEVPHVGSDIASITLRDRFMLTGETAGLFQYSLPETWSPGFSLPPGGTLDACLGGSIDITAAASARPNTITYQWFRSGGTTPLANGATGWGSQVSGATTQSLSIASFRPQDAAHYYWCVATNSCGATISPTTSFRICPPDFNCSGSLTVQDIFDFLSAWFAAAPASDFNGVGGITVQDIFDFLAAWFAGCP